MQFFETTPNLQTVFKNKAYIKSCVKKTKKIFHKKKTNNNFLDSASLN
jgi:hypothetical protein